MRVHGEDPVSTKFNIFCRLDGRAGLQRADSLVTIPGHLFASAKGTTARLDPANTFGTSFLKGVEGVIQGVGLPAGTWRFTAVGVDPSRLSVSRQSDGILAKSRADGLELALAKGGRVDLMVAGTPPAFLIEVVARRVGD